MKKNGEYDLYKVNKISSVRDILKQAEKEAGNKIAFKFKENKEIKEVTYKEFIKDINELGTILTDMKLDKTHVAVIGENSYNWLTIYLTMLGTNGVVVPIDKELTCEQIINILKHSDSEVLFFADKYKKFIPEFKENLPNVKYYIGFSEKEDAENILSYEKFKEKGKKLLEQGNKEYLKIKTDVEALRLLVYTSGTTGAPKGVMLSERNLISCVYYGLQVATIYDTCLSVLPYHHTYEAVAGILVALHHHSTICINDSLKAVLQNLQLYKPDYIYLVPAFAEVFYKKIWANAKEGKKEALLKMLIKTSNGLRKIGIDLRGKLFKSIHEAFGGNLKEIVCGGAPIRPEIGTFFESIGIDLLNGYGITECSPLVSVNRFELNDPSTVGIVLPCCEVKFENIDSDGNGEVVVKGKIVMMGYYKNKELTNEVLKDGWFNTGDFGRMNDKKQLIITGRKKNVIVLKNGKNVFPEEIENFIARIPYITEVIVRGIKDENNSEVGLLAEVFLNEEKLKELNIENVEETLKKDIKQVCKELPVYKHITEIKIRDKEFPKTTTNKIKR